MKKTLLLIMMAMLLFSCSQMNNKPAKKDADTILKIYSYDSFISWGLGKAAIPAFEKKYNCTVKFESVGDAGAMLNRLIMEKENPKADIAIGIDNTFLQKALDNDVFDVYKPDNAKLIDRENILDKSWHLTPFDYGYFAFVYDSDVIKNPPKTFGELQSSVYKNKIIIIDPRTSSPGKGLFLWSLAAFGDKGFNTFWSALKPNILTIPSSWDEAYNAFLTGEAPIVLSYSTSPAYHIENDKTDRYKAFIPEEGAFKQTEGAGIVKNCSNPNLARKFIEYMLTEDFQKHIPTTQWMYPVAKNVAIPQSFNTCPTPVKVLNDQLKPDDFNESRINQWLKIMTK